MLNQYKIVGDVLVVYNRKDGREILFDAEDFDFVSKRTWYINYKKEKKGIVGYAKTNIRQSDGKKTCKLASRLLMNEPVGMMIDHINGNTLDNRKVNLRIVTDQINNHNNKKAKGYCWSTRDKKWLAYIYINNKRIHLGLHDTEDKARGAYLSAKKIYHPTAPHHLYK